MCWMVAVRGVRSECKDGGYMAVGALEPQSFEELVKGLSLDAGLNSRRHDRSTCLAMKGMFSQRFKARTRTEWEQVFDGKDACCTPALSQIELDQQGYKQRPAVGLTYRNMRPGVVRVCHQELPVRRC